MQPFCYGLSDGSGKPVQMNGEPVIRIVVLAGVENSFEKMVCLTLSGKVYLRSIDGRKSSRAKPDMFVMAVGNPPDIINT